MYYPEELIEEVRQKNDIVDVISGMLVYRKKAVITYVVALFTVKRHHLFLSVVPDRSINVLDAAKQEM